MVTAPISSPGDSWCLSPTCSPVSSQHRPKEEMNSFQQQPLRPPGAAPGQVMYPPNWQGGGTDPVFLAKDFNLLNLNHQQPGGNRDQQMSKVSRVQVWSGRAHPSTPRGLAGAGKGRKQNLQVWSSPRSTTGVPLSPGHFQQAPGTDAVSGGSSGLPGRESGGSFLGALPPAMTNAVITASLPPPPYPSSAAAGPLLSSLRLGTPAPWRQMACSDGHLHLQPQPDIPPSSGSKASTGREHGDLPAGTSRSTPRPSCF